MQRCRSRVVFEINVRAVSAHGLKELVVALGGGPHEGGAAAEVRVVGDLLKDKEKGGQIPIDS